MNEFEELAAHYIAAWNETDPAARRTLVRQVWSDGGSYVDPMAEALGHDAIDATLGAVQAQFPGLVFTLIGPVDAHHRQARFRWGLGPVDGPDLVEGFDVVQQAADGRLQTVLGFLDRVPV